MLLMFLITPKGVRVPQGIRKKMKKKRLEKILEIIEKHRVETQEEMQKHLLKAGFDVTQATVSRDINELKLIKALSSDGKYYYTAMKVDPEKQDKLYKIFRDSVISVDYALNTAVIKCEVGMASAACAAFDSMNFQNVLGSIAGDDTIFIIMRTENSAAELTKILKKHIAR